MLFLNLMSMTPREMLLLAAALTLKPTAATAQQIDP
jgi:hypothetical protein